MPVGGMSHSLRRSKALGLQRPWSLTPVGLGPPSSSTALGLCYLCVKHRRRGQDSGR